MKELTHVLDVNSKQFSDVESAQALAYRVRALATGLARYQGTNPDGSGRLCWMPGFVPLEYLRAENRARLGVLAPDPVLDPRGEVPGTSSPAGRAPGPDAELEGGAA